MANEKKTNSYLLQHLHVKILNKISSTAIHHLNFKKKQLISVWVWWTLENPVNFLNISPLLNQLILTFQHKTKSRALDTPTIYSRKNSAKEYIVLGPSGINSYNSIKFTLILNSLEVISLFKQNINIYCVNKYYLSLLTLRGYLPPQLNTFYTCRKTIFFLIKRKTSIQQKFSM